MGLVCGFLTAYFIVVLGRVILSWFPMAPDGVGGQVYGVTVALTEPVLGPLRRTIPPLRLGATALDLSPLIVFFGIQILQAVIGCG